MQIEVHLKVFIVLKKINSIKENEILFGWNVWKIKSFLDEKDIKSKKNFK